jgi:hypothetical protein
MTRTVAKTIRFQAKLLRPAAGKGVSWSFLMLPRQASAKLPTRGLTTVTGSLQGVPFQATLAPDGQRSHWLKVPRTLREAAKAEIGEVVALEITPVEKEPEPRVPADLRRELAATPRAQGVWADLTPVARRDWIHWITSAKRSETRARRVANACDMLASGKRRVCCFDGSGIYSKGLSAPQAAE